MNGENARICSISSPKNSTRSGSRPVVAKTSTSPPRTANCPRSSTRSTRSYPADASCAASTSIPGSLPGAMRIASGPLTGRRHTFRDGGRRRAHEPAALEHGESADALADEVRRRLEARAPVHAAGREERDVLVAEEPTGCLGCVAGVGVLRQQHDQAALATRRAAPPGRAAGRARRRERASAARRRTPAAAPPRGGVRRGCRERDGP